MRHRTTHPVSRSAYAAPAARPLSLVRDPGNHATLPPVNGAGIGANVARVLAQLADMGEVTPAERVALRAAVASLTLADEPTFTRSGDSRPWHSTTEVAKWLRTTPPTVRKMCRAGEFPGAMTLSGRPGSDWRIPPAAVTAYLAAHGISA